MDGGAVRIPYTLKIIKSDYRKTKRNQTICYNFEYSNQFRKKTRMILANDMWGHKNQHIW